MREDAPWSFGEERILVDAVTKQRRRKRERFGLVAQLVAGTPVRGHGIDRIEDHVAAFGRVELRCVLERRVVDDRRVAPVLELAGKRLNLTRRRGDNVSSIDTIFEQRVDGL